MGAPIRRRLLSGSSKTSPERGKGERMKDRQQKPSGDERVDPIKMAVLEQELIDLKKEQGILPKATWRTRLVDFLTRRTAGPRRVSRRAYILLALCCGWFCGAHRFYSGHRLLGFLYLAFCWTGIPVAMTLIDLMVVLPMPPDEEGKILL